MSKKFDWDPDKNQSNIEKHGLSFEEAKDVFDDPNRIEEIDDRKDYGETRRKTIGFSASLNILGSVVYTFRDLVYRLISFRRASRKERKEYLNQNKNDNKQ